MVKIHDKSAKVQKMQIRYNGKSELIIYEYDNEFKKIANVIKKTDESAPHDVVLVLDATSGQNIINQLEEFDKIIKVTGLIMTKLDGTAKGGVLIAISKKYKVPILGLGLGEKEDDLQIFNAEQFADAFTQFN